MITQTCQNDPTDVTLQPELLWRPRWRRIPILRSWDSLYSILPSPPRMPITDEPCAASPPHAQRRPEGCFALDEAGGSAALKHKNFIFTFLFLMSFLHRCTGTGTDTLEAQMDPWQPQAAINRYPLLPCTTHGSMTSAPQAHPIPTRLSPVDYPRRVCTGDFNTLHGGTYDSLHDETSRARDCNHPRTGRPLACPAWVPRHRH
ncbi:hypothetical protein N658DRAFT_193236 [Parathielavia hyrcaniae]|uniref:Uncharacterized protein n=1 Tax=Parathielavia hyrcaniae TaxID=113614 RepID=A0AAN6T4W9_9PEZI|nr:hypothetical protein N658DRAFT_193236 [Parathielavia hyrcaniae]